MKQLVSTLVCFDCLLIVTVIPDIHIGLHVYGHTCSPSVLRTFSKLLWHYIEKCSCNTAQLQNKNSCEHLSLLSLVLWGYVLWAFVLWAYVLWAFVVASLASVRRNHQESLKWFNSQTVNIFLIWRFLGKHKAKREFRQVEFAKWNAPFGTFVCKAVEHGPPGKHCSTRGPFIRRRVDKDWVKKDRAVARTVRYMASGSHLCTPKPLFAMSVLWGSGVFRYWSANIHILTPPTQWPQCKES